MNTQQGAIATGGLRLGVGATDYDELFREVANASITEARLPCTFEPPRDGAQPLDLQRVRFRLVSNGGATEQVYRQVPGEGMCGADGGFYEEGGLLQLCPTTCDAVRTDPTAEAQFSFECSPG